MAGGKSSSASSVRPRAEDFARPDSDTTDPNASAGRNDETNPGADAPAGASFKLIALRGPRAGTEFPLDAVEVTVGRGADNPISIPDISVSRTHVQLRRQGDAVTITDLKSGNGTKVNGARVESAVLKHGDEITLGDTVLQFIQVGEPPVTGARAAAPSGQSAAPSVPTESRQAPVVAIPTRPVQAPVIVGKAGTSATPKTTDQTRRVRRLLLMIVLVLVAFAGLYAWKHRDEITDRIDEFRPTRASTTSSDALQRVRPLIRDRQWVEVAKALRQAAPLHSDDDLLQEWAKDAQIEADAEVGFEKAKDALQRGEYKEAMDRSAAVDPDADYGDDAQKLLKSIPNALDLAVKDAEAAMHAGERTKAQEIVTRVLEANPNHQAALELKEELGRPLPKAKPPRDIIIVEHVDPGPQAPAYPCYGPAITAIQSDDLASALHWANAKPVPTCPNLAAMITEFGNQYRRATELEAGKHIPEAVIAFNKALTTITDIMKDRPSKPGRTVHEHLSNMEYLLALDCKGDDQLPRRAQHLNSAIKANPQNDTARRELDRVFTRAREIFQDAYIQRPSAPDVSLKEFKIVANTLPPTDEKQVKALNWIKKIQGLPQP